MTVSDRKTPSTEAMFTKIAERYDRCNHWFSLGIDRLWRKRLARAVDAAAGDAALDICCGTGDMAFALLKYSAARAVIGADCSERMIQLAQEKRMRLAVRRWMTDKTLRLHVADAAAMPFEDGAFDVVTCAFGLRNIPDRAAVLRQVSRVLKPGGRLGVCEFSLPKNPTLRAVYGVYLSRVMPLLGRLVLGDGDALRYLARSILDWDATVRLEAELTQTGFVDVCATPLTGGIVTLTVGRKA
ncbi:MAG: ubiquinone/menaquinone biosynthesis methyltransferase [Phycisphaerae bacterium]|nr:ubiquinone/menaquinone biosynthesis methyltransferase [Phycisphaerae bacterium]